MHRSLFLLLARNLETSQYLFPSDINLYNNAYIKLIQNFCMFHLKMDNILYTNMEDST